MSDSNSSSLSKLESIEAPTPVTSYTEKTPLVEEAGSELPLIGPVLTLRELANSTFINFINCPSGRITVIQDVNDSSTKTFRNFLLGKETSVQIDARYGTRDLHPSEIKVVGAETTILGNKTVEDVLLEAGSDKKLIEPILKAAGLIDYVSQPLATLDEVALKRLSLCCALFSKATVLVFDKPFSQVGEQWVDALASIMLEAVARSTQVFIVLGEEKLPIVWRTTQKVLFKGGRSRKNSFSMSRSNIEKVFDGVRPLIGSNRNSVNIDSHITTRPQSIRRKGLRSTAKETIQIEAIANPQLEVNRSTDSKMITRPKIETGSGSKKRPEKQLTTVTTIERIGVFAFYQTFRRKLKKIAAKLLVDDFSNIQILSTAKLEEIQRRQFYNRVFLVMISIVIVLWILNLIGVGNRN